MDLTDHWTGVGEVPRWISAPANPECCTVLGGASAQCAECSHTLLTSSFWSSSASSDNRQQVLGLTWRAMLTLYSGAALSVLDWMTPRCLQQSESLPFLKRGLPATTSCGAFQRGNVGKLFYPLVKKSNRKITIILMPPRNAYYSRTTKVLSLPRGGTQA